MNNKLEIEDLIGLFESEPMSGYSKNIPWQYQKVAFHTIREGESLLVRIEESIGEIIINWERNAKVLSNIALTDMESISVQLLSGDEFLSANGSFGDYLISLKLRLKPFISVELKQVRDF